MSFSYSLGSNPTIDYVRLLVGDTVSLNHIWEDEEIQSAYVIDTAWAIAPAGGGFPTQSTGTPSARRAAAVLLDGLASNKARISAQLKVLDIEINPESAAKQIREQASYFRTVESEMGFFAIAEMVPDQFAARERVWKQMLRLQT